MLTDWDKLIVLAAAAMIAGMVTSRPVPMEQRGLHGIGSGIAWFGFWIAAGMWIN